MNKGSFKGTHNDGVPHEKDVNSIEGLDSEILGTKKLFLNNTQPSNKSYKIISKISQVLRDKSELVAYPRPGGITWVARTSNFGATQVSVIRHGNGIWVAAGDAGTLRTSTDTVTWVTRVSNFGTSSISSVAHNGLSGASGLWTAVGGGGTLRTSTDAITWVTRTSNFDILEIYNVAYANNLWVAVGGDGQLRTSADAITWVTRNSNFGISDIATVTYGNGLWAIGGAFGRLGIATSTDAITWVLRHPFGSDLSNVRIAYGNNIWIASFSTAGVITSTDAIVWVTNSALFPSGNSVPSGLAFGNGLFMLATGTTLGSIRSSPDGINWSEESFTTPGSMPGSIRPFYANGIWVAGGSNGALYSSSSVDSTKYFTRAQSSGLTIGYKV